jgi:hypothetical protein
MSTSLNIHRVASVHSPLEVRSSGSSAWLGFTVEDSQGNLHEVTLFAADVETALKIYKELTSRISEPERESDYEEATDAIS